MCKRKVCRILRWICSNIRKWLELESPISILISDPHPPQPNIPWEERQSEIFKFFYFVGGQCWNLASVMLAAKDPIAVIVELIIKSPASEQPAAPVVAKELIPESTTKMMGLPDERIMEGGGYFPSSSLSYSFCWCNPLSLDHPVSFLKQTTF